MLQSGTFWRNSAALQLKAGVLYDVELTVNRIRESLSIKWETPKRPREVIPGRYLYPAGVDAPFHAGYVRFLKVAALASALRLSANELVTFANDASLNVAGDGWLNVLPTADSPSPAVAAALLAPLERLLEFARLKAELSPDDERVLDILKDPAGATGAVDGLFYALVGGDRPSLDALLAQFGGTIGELADFELFRRVCDAFAVMGKIGVGASAAIRATTNAPDAGVVRAFGSAVRARFEEGSWREMIQPLNDRLRSMQRDALAAHILHRMSENPATASIDTPDKLFEYFLMDVQMEPCMQTSRIRHALSTVQLFIERCSMNLEVDVSPSSINSKQWAWMKRYRVWEANRKVFLYPENWIEPELRDDKSPFFKEIESQLLQSDITEEAATSAYLTYLSRLEEVAKLEPCGLHYVEPTSTPFEPAVMHVVARTPGAKRKYYYRRFDHGTWTAWDPIKLDIPDNPVVPVVWQDRLLLFWLRLMKKNPDGVQRPAGNKSLTELRTDDIPHDHATKLQAVLCWSEYYDGKWQAEKTSDINAPANLDEGRLTSLLTPERLRSVIHAKDAPLRIDLSEWSFFSFDPVARPVTFLVHNTHSLPEIEYPATAHPLANGRILGPDIVYLDANENATVRRVLTAGGAYHVAEPTHELADTWNAPFFYEDRHHAFLVTSDHQPVWIKDFGNYGVFVNPNLVDSAMMRPLILPPPPPPSGGLRVTEDAFVNKGLSTATAVTFNGRRIGPTGA